MDKIKKKLITHNGAFHTDDLFACATLALVMENENNDYEIIRTREEQIIKNGDYVFDVGGIYDADTNRYDHHQRGGAGARDNGIEYSSFGLVWKHFGLKLCDGDQEVWSNIDQSIACPIDANDNGMDIMTLKYSGIKPYEATRVFRINAPTWKEEDVITDKVFLEQVQKIKDLLKREIKVAKDDVEGKNIILDSYKNSLKKEIVILNQDFPRYLIQHTLSVLLEPIYVVYPSAHSQKWKIEAIMKNPETLESRKLFPEGWRGLTNHDENIIETIGIKGVLFVHRNGFYANCETKEEAVEFAERSLLA